MATARVVDRTRRAVSEVLRRQGYVSAVDVFLELGTLTRQDLEDWRFGRVPFLERKLIGGLGKLSTTLREMKRLCGELGLKPSQTAYMKWGKGPKRALRFSKSGKPHVEQAYRTHWVSKRVASQHSRRGMSPDTAKPRQAASIGFRASGAPAAAEAREGSRSRRATGREQVGGKRSLAYLPEVRSPFRT
jgi:hypothetical protein